MRIFAVILLVLTGGVGLNAEPLILDLLGGSSSNGLSSSNSVSSSNTVSGGLLLGALPDLLNGVPLLDEINTAVKSILSPFLDAGGLSSLQNVVANSSLLTNLLKGVTGKDGILSIVNKVFNLIPCLLQKLGLQKVLRIMPHVAVLDNLSLLNAVCNSQGGDDLLSILSGDNGILTKITPLLKSTLGGLISKNQSSILTALFNNGLSGSLLTGPNGLNLLGNVLNSAGCMLGKLGLNDTLALVNKVVDTKQLLGLGKACNATGGSDLLSGLLANDVLLQPLLTKVICLINSLGVDVIPILNSIGLSTLSKLPGFNCSSGGLLNGSLHLTDVVHTLENVLATVLPKEQMGSVLSSLLNSLPILSDLSSGVIGLSDLLKPLVCLLETLGVNKVLSMIPILGNTKQILGLSVICNSTGGSDVLSTIVGNRKLFNDTDLLDAIVCIVQDVTGINISRVTDAIDFPDLVSFVGDYCTNGGLVNLGENLSPLLMTSLDTLKQLGVLSNAKLSDVISLIKSIGTNVLDLPGALAKLFCMLKSMSPKVVADVIASLKLDLVLQMLPIICKDGQLIFTSATAAIYFDGLDQATKLKIAELSRLLNVPESTVIEKLTCIAQIIGLNRAASMALETKSLSYYECVPVDASSGAGVLAALIKAIGSESDRFFNITSPNAWVRTALLFFDTNGNFDINLYTKYYCIASAGNGTSFINSSDDIIRFDGLLCKNGQPVYSMFNNVIINCNLNNTSLCQSTMTDLILQPDCPACKNNGCDQELTGKVAANYVTECNAECVNCINNNNG